MSSPFETIRAFQAPDNAPEQRVFVPAQQPPIVKIQCGRNGASIKTFNADISAETSAYLEQRPTEVLQS